MIDTKINYYDIKIGYWQKISDASTYNILSIIL